MKLKIEIMLFFFVTLFNVMSVMSKTVTDEAGRIINTPDSPMRIIALAPSVTEIVFEVGQGHLLVGATRFSDYPKKANSLPKVGSYIHLDLEKIVALKPDLCIGIKDGNTLSVVQRLGHFNIPVYIINPQNLNSVMVSIRNIGELLNQTENSQALIESMSRKINEVKQKLSGVLNRPGVFFQIGIAPIVSVGTDTFIHDLITTAGGKNLTMGSNPYPRYSMEQVLNLKPDVIIITSMSQGETFKQEIARWKQWPDLPAAKHHNISVVDSNVFDRPSPRLVIGLELLAKLIHPELFPITQE